MLTEELATRLAEVALANIERAHPRHAQQLLLEPGQERDERKLHPAFYGSYDWHSAVHMHWLLVRVARLYPVSRIAARITPALDAHLSEQTIQAELQYFQSPAGRTFERPYGWAWLLGLQAEALRLQSRWGRALDSLAKELAGRMTSFVSAPYPVRAGSHGNTAFACVLALDYARTAKDLSLELEIKKAARRWYQSDRDAPIAYEPSLDDFLSPSLIEAVLMRAVLDDDAFFAWLTRFAPDGFGALAEPPIVADHADPKQSHLDGLCFSRGWCFYRLGREKAAQRLIEAALHHVTGDYAGRHWLASFALLALSAAALESP